MSSTIIATWFVADTADTASQFPQVGGSSATAEFQAVYWRCIVAFYVTSKRMNPGIQHVLYTNSGALPVIDQVPIETSLRKLDVQVIHLPIRHRLPTGYVHAWGNQFYIFDIIAHASRTLTNERLLVFDSDCLFIRPVGAMEAAIDRHGALTYTLYRKEAPEFLINGLSRVQMAKLAETVFKIEVDFVEYSGGEMFAASAHDCRAMLPLIESLWNYSTASPSRLFAHEEAQALSIVYRAMGYADLTGNPFLKRIWTTLRRSNASVQDFALSVWHLPAEKRRGFRPLFRECVNPRSKLNRLTDDDELRRHYGGLMGIPNRSPLKFSLDLTGKIIEHSGKYFNKLTQVAP